MGSIMAKITETIMVTILEISILIWMEAIMVMEMVIRMVIIMETFKMIEQFKTEIEMKEKNKLVKILKINSWDKILKMEISLI